MTPYKVLIAELLLRKTGSVVVAQEYDAFIKRYPDAESLARASSSEIAASIRRLGIADRGRLFKALGECLVLSHRGRVPASLDALLALPGVGRYTANAVACFAFRQPVPIVDTNVIRVLDRIFSVKSLKSRPHTDAGLWKAAAAFVPCDRPVAFNRALLDFAAAICAARDPRCAECPMASLCDYYAVKNSR